MWFLCCVILFAIVVSYVCSNVLYVLLLCYYFVAIVLYVVRMCSVLLVVFYMF